MAGNPLPGVVYIKPDFSDSAYKARRERTAMDTIPEHEVRRLRGVLGALTVGSALVHGALCVFCILRALPARGADGFGVLALVFLLSCAAQCFYAHTTWRQCALETFRQPCLLRWVECAATSALQVFLLATCLLIRDAHTLALLAAAQAASVLAGFALEYALGTRDLQDPIEQTYLGQSPPTLISAPTYEFGPGAAICGPTVDKRFMRSQTDKAERAWEVCFGAAFLLHAAVWAVLVSQLLAVEAAVCGAYSPAQLCVATLRVLVAGQCALFSCFALVQLLQLFWLWTRDVDASAALLYGSVLYAVLSLVGKSFLLASYVTFVDLIPPA